MPAMAMNCRLYITCIVLVSIAASSDLSDKTVTLTPWCDNSFRVRIAPTNMPAATEPAADALAKTLEAKNMSDLRGALIDKCTPSTPVTASRDAPTAHGNLVATLGDDSISFSRKDTGALLFTAKTSFALNGFSGGTWSTIHDKITRGCTGSEFAGGLGSFDTAEGCLQAVQQSSLPINYAVWRGDSNKGCFTCDLSDRGDSSTWKYTSMPGAASFVGPSIPKPGAGYLSANLSITAGDKDEVLPRGVQSGAYLWAMQVVYGLGQGNWTNEGGCPAAGPAGSRIVPLERNGQSVDLQQRKFHVSIPFTYSTAGYVLLFNMPGYGAVTIGSHGTGGAQWSAEAALYLDFWVSALPAEVEAPNAGPLYRQYADATGHAPPLREDAMVFWQSRNRYKSSDIALSIAERYEQLQLDVGVLVIDYKNQLHDGDFAPNPACYPSVAALSKGVRAAINATTMFSFWPEVMASSPEYPVLLEKGCLINGDLGGRAVDATIPECRAFIWSTMLKPRYYDQGVDAFWLDETDGEGTGGGGDGDYGYNTSYGPPVAYSNLWVNDWLSLYSDPVAAEPRQTQPPLVLTRGVWAGGQRHGIVLWSSDIHSSFDQLASQVPQGVHASMSGIPWWTTVRLCRTQLGCTDWCAQDVGGYGCGESQPNESPYMKELIVRWYQFGAFSPVFRTHGCRNAPSEPNTDACSPHQGSCGFNEIWSYGNDTQALLEPWVRLRSALKPYIQELDKNVTAFGVPTMRPLALEFPHDQGCRGNNDQYFLGPEFLVAPVTLQNATSRSIYFPAGAQWQHFILKGQLIEGGQRITVDAPLTTMPVYVRASSRWAQMQVDI